MSKPGNKTRILMPPDHHKETREVDKCKAQKPTWFSKPSGAKKPSARAAGLMTGGAKAFPKSSLNRPVTLPHVSILDDHD